MAWALNKDKPIYAQLVEVIGNRIISGEYGAGEKVPSVRELAAEAAVNPNTMQKAFAELERKGMIITARTSGRAVTEDKELLKNLRFQMARDQINEFFDNMKKMGFEQDEVICLMKNVVEGEQ
ncbi:MAG: GntR family transcriptional regulator [Clostridia bacterium]|nr:GntR family transcriptional regulator [Clostridia bacterium]